MGIYPAVLTASALVGAVCAGFILAQSPRRRATQLASLLGVGAAWWALCGALWNTAPDADSALHWMALSTPGWAFIGGLLPHLVARYHDAHPVRELAPRRRLLGFAAGFGYAAGAAELFLSWMGWGVHGDPVRVSWGWAYTPGAGQVAYLIAVGPPIALSLVGVSKLFRSPLSVAPRAHRIAIRIGILIPVVFVGVTDVLLPIAGLRFVRLGSTAYALFGVVALVTGLRYGLSFFTPQKFSKEILDTLSEGVAMVTLRGVIRQANHGLARLAGSPLEAMAGIELRRLLAWEPPPDLSAVQEEPAMLAAPRGHSIPVLVSSAPLRDDAGNAIGVVVVVRDQREVEDLRRSMLTQARLAAVGELAAGLAHEMNNPLAFVRANLSQLERLWRSLCDAGERPVANAGEIAAEGRELIEESAAGVDRAAEIVRGVCRFVHAGLPAREPADLNEIVAEALTMLGSQAREAGLRVEFHPGLVPPVPCAPQEMLQAVLHLVTNALDFADKRDLVEVSTFRDGGEAVVSVRDTGPGIPLELLDRIFDPFFTTKGVGAGTGLGLAIAWQIVTAHGGRIDVESPPGGGATFRVRIPLDPDPSRRAG